MSYDDAWLLQQLQKPGYRLVQGTVAPPESGHMSLTLAEDAPERDLQGRVQTLCKEVNALYWHALKSQGSTAGMPDCLIINGHILHTWELKSAGAEPSPAQRRWLAALAQVTEIDVATYWPKDWPIMVEKLLRK